MAPKILAYNDYQNNSFSNYDFSFIVMTFYLILLTIGMFLLHGNFLELTYKFQELEMICSG